MPITVASRPTLDASLSGDELRRWYWLRDELAEFARRLDVSAAGGKAELTDRIAARLDGLPPVPVRRAGRTRTPLQGPFSEATVVPTGQRCSQQLRGWFVGQIGLQFRFDGAMRSWFADADGTATLGDAVAHWYATREAQSAFIGRQFEFNRFSRNWHAEHPGGTRDQLLRDWTRYREAPVDARPPV